MGKRLLAARLAITSSFHQLGGDSTCFAKEHMCHGARVRFVGVAHAPRTFQLHQPLIDREMRDADVLVLEADSQRLAEDRKLISQWRSGMKKKWHEYLCSLKGVEFYELVARHAKLLEKPFYCFEPPDPVRNAKTDWKMFGIALAGIGAALSALLTGWRMLVGGVSLQDAAVYLGATGIMLWSLWRTFDYIYDFTRRNVAVMNGILDLIKRKAPSSITVIYGAAHIAPFIAYLEHPDLLAYHQRKYGIREVLS